MNLLRSCSIPSLLKAIDLMARRKWLFLSCIVAFCAVEISGNALYAAGIRGAINALTGMAPSELLQWVSIIIISRAIWWVYAPVSTYCCAWASKGTLQRLKTELVDHILRMPMSELDKRRDGALLSLLTNDLDCLLRLYDGYLFQILRTSLGGLAGIIMMAVIEWRFAVIVLILGSFSLLITSKFNGKLKKGGETLQQAFAQTSVDFHELIRGAKTLRLLRLQPYILNRVSISSQAEANQRLENGAVMSGLKSILSVISAMTYGALLVSGALFVHAGLAQWGTVVSVMGLKTATDMLFVEFGDFMAGMQTCLSGVGRLISVLEQPPEADGTVHMTIAPSDCPLTFKGVSFDYAGVPVLNNLSFRLPKQGLTVLSGETGSGKSTVMKLILGLYQPQQGTILFDGTEPSSLETVRAKTAYVPQTPLLFRGSVLENILFGNSVVSRADAVDAARLAGADAFILELEQGYDTILHDNGANLSSGQKQRIAIARALVKNAPVLLLDEITSALDRDAEDKILSTILNIAQAKSVLFITHSSRIIDRADQVYKLEPTAGF